MNHTSDLRVSTAFPEHPMIQSAEPVRVNQIKENRRSRDKHLDFAIFIFTSVSVSSSLRFTRTLEARLHLWFIRSFSALQCIFEELMLVD